MLAGLPRLVRVAEEIRWRGQASLSLGVAVAAYWAMSWLLGDPVDPIRGGISAAAVAALTLALCGLSSASRVREGLRETLPPPRLSVYETVADGRERRARFGGIVLLGAVVLLVFDRVTNGDGTMAGLLTGLFIAAGAVDLGEARRWRTAERDRDARLYVLIRANAMVARFGRAEIYEERRPDPDRRPDPVAFGP
jgi:hypothetical protein